MNFGTSIRRLILGALAVSGFVMACGVTPSLAQTAQKVGSGALHDQSVPVRAHHVLRGIYSRPYIVYEDLNAKVRLLPFAASFAHRLIEQNQS